MSDQDKVVVSIYVGDTPGVYYIDEDCDPKWYYHVKVPRALLEEYRQYREQRDRLMLQLAKYHEQQEEPEG